MPAGIREVRKTPLSRGLTQIFVELASASTHCGECIEWNGKKQADGLRILSRLYLADIVFTLLLERRVQRNCFLKLQVGAGSVPRLEIQRPELDMEF